MIANFFQRLESSGVAYLLISGQATILYGAATFSEDVDLWISPDSENLSRLMGALRDVGARYYKLTPPLDTKHLNRGHGFHFVLPGDAEEAAVYLDVMGKPPRVGSFEAAAGDSRVFETDFGRVPTVSIKDLVELKKTQRPEDYPVISRLVAVYLTEAGSPPATDDLYWAFDNTFGVDELRALLREHASAYRTIETTLPDVARRALETLEHADELDVSTENEIDAWLETRRAALRAADRSYWRGIIAELRELRSSKALMEEGVLV